MIFDSHGNRYTINATTYSILRKIAADNMRGDNNPSKRQEVREKMSKTQKENYKNGSSIPWLKGGHQTDATKLKCKIGVTKYFENNDEARKNLSVQASARWKNTPEEIKLEIGIKRSMSGKAYNKTPEGIKKNKDQSIRQSGENNPMFGVPPKVKGGKWMNDGNTESIFHNIEEMQNSGWSIGRIKRNKNGNE